MNILHLFPGPRHNSLHLVCFAEISSSIVPQISLYSNCTISSSRSPFAWYLASTSRAAPSRPLLTSHRGLSGRKKIPIACKTDGRAWKTEGILHAQVEFRRNVPKVIHAAMIEPACYFSGLFTALRSTLMTSPWSIACSIMQWQLLFEKDMQVR